MRDTHAMADIAARLADLDWSAIERSLWEWGYAKTPPVLTPDECAELDRAVRGRRALPQPGRHGALPLRRRRLQVLRRPAPPLVQALRTHAYPPLAAIANQFEAALDTATLHPTAAAGLLALCHRGGQTKPTPLLLHYEAGGYNCLHQDIYGDVVFPLQLTCFLSRRGGGLRGRRLPAGRAAAPRAVARRGASPPSRARS